MDTTLESLKAQLEGIVSKLKTQVPNDEPLSIAHGNPLFPGVSQSDLVNNVQDVIDIIDTYGVDDLGDGKNRLQDYVRRLEYLSSNTVQQIWGAAQHAIPAFMLTVDGLRKLLEAELNSNPRQELISQIKKIRAQVRSMEATLNGLHPRTVVVAELVEGIERAYNAADRLPTDLEALEEARERISKLHEQAVVESKVIKETKVKFDILEIYLQDKEDSASEVLKKCETAYSAATSVGLAAAFTERSTALDRSSWFWIFGLIISLGIGGAVGFIRLKALAELLQIPTASTSTITLNLLLSIFSVGAPVWFAWLATKQIGQRFRLSEDYAFKASISRAYEGFRREAARHGKDMEARILSSALSRLDEIPLRFIEKDNHGSPFQEIMSSDTVKRALQIVPDFSDQVKNLAKESIDSVISVGRMGVRRPEAPLRPQDQDIDGAN